MNRRAIWILCLMPLMLSLPPARAQVQEACYVASSAVEGMVPPVSRLRLRVTGKETVRGREFVWWEFTAALSGSTSVPVPNFDAGVFGVRVLSDRPPMTATEGVGSIERYIYRDARGRVLEYIDAPTGKALVPVHQFREACIPRPSRYAGYDQGFASAGTLLGHVLMRVPRLDDLEPVSFDSPRVLKLRSDLIMAAQGSVRLDESAPVTKNNEPNFRPFTRAEYEAIIAAGMNCFGLAPAHSDWLVEQPVFFHGKPSFPDSLYRGNYLTARLYMDEPCVRMGWSGGVLHPEGGPEQVAEILRERVASQLTLAERAMEFPKWARGTIDFISPPFISWETDYFSAWYQLEAGAAALVHEGRYSEHGEGWNPRDLFGQEGLDGLRLEEQVRCFNGVMRGAARAFDRDWGVSVYKESDPRLRQPALNLAYDMGARYIWFWTYGDMDYEEQLRLLNGLGAHIRAHPRGDLRTVNRSAKLGIVFPPGCVLLWNGSWGMEREQLSPEGATYGDITAAAVWEGICSSLRGEPFDFLIDEPFISSLGYERLVRVGTDGRVKVTPSWPGARAASGLELALADDEAEDISVRVQSEPPAVYNVPRSAAISIDGELSDWERAKWISLDDRHAFPDGVTLSTKLINDVSRDEWRMSFHHGLGMKWEQVGPAHEKKYQLEDLHEKGVVVTQVDPGSPAEKAGIQEGDVIRHTEPWPINWSFQMYQRLGHYSKSKGGETIPFTIRRSGRFQFGGQTDLSARVAMAVDDENLYLAAHVTDDVHSQRRFGRELFRGDSLYIGFDPTLERKDDKYGEENQEFGFTLQDGKTIVWRYRGRRGQPLGEMSSVHARVARGEGKTLYEAAIPLAELKPLSPDLWPACGFGILINDSDGTLQRKARLERRHKAMSPGRHPKGFETLRFAPSPDSQKVSAAIFWRRRATPEGGFFRVVLAACSPKAPKAQIVAELASLDSPETPSMKATLPLPLSPEPREHSLTLGTESPAGRYRLSIQVVSDEGKVAVADALPVYVYPRPKSE